MFVSRLSRYLVFCLIVKIFLFINYPTILVVVKVSEYAEDDVEGDLVYAVQVITVMFTIVQVINLNNEN